MPARAPVSRSPATAATRQTGRPRVCLAVSLAWIRRRLLFFFFFTIFLSLFESRRQDPGGRLRFSALGLCAATRRATADTAAAPQHLRPFSLSPQRPKRLCLGAEFFRGVFRHSPCSEKLTSDFFFFFLKAAGLGACAWVVRSQAPLLRGTAGVHRVAAPTPPSQRGGQRYPLTGRLFFFFFFFRLYFWSRYAGVLVGWWARVASKRSGLCERDFPEETRPAKSRALMTDPVRHARRGAWVRAHADAFCKGPPGGWLPDNDDAAGAPQ